MFRSAYAGKRVLITGHTGFKGSWLSTWLLDLGADVAGYSVGLPSTPCNFEALRLETRLRHYGGDVRDRARLLDVFDDFHPQCVFHLAAQSLVRRSYADPVMTFEVNTLGTVNVLECIRQHPAVQGAVIVTSDKCYRNYGWPWGYRETDTLGGEDPYSASKGAAELVCYAYARSFLGTDAGRACVASARAGNVIGGGDWAEDRLIPDCVRSWSRGETAVIRHPRATRPWQHVLEPLSGYLWLGAHLLTRDPRVAGSAYNFGPPANLSHPVEVVIREFGRHWPVAKWVVDEEQRDGCAESSLLTLSCDKALSELGWQTVLSFEDTLRYTGEWYRHYYERNGEGIADVTHRQIGEYCRQAAERKLPWITN